MRRPHPVPVQQDLSAHGATRFSVSTGFTGFLFISFDAKDLLLGAIFAGRIEDVRGV